MMNTQLREGVASMEWAVEVHTSKERRSYGASFVRQLDVFQTYEDAEHFAKTTDEELGKDEYIDIVYIEYDEDEDEVGAGIEQRWEPNR